VCVSKSRAAHLPNPPGPQLVLVGGLDQSLVTLSVTPLCFYVGTQGPCGRWGHGNFAAVTPAFTLHAPPSLTCIHYRLYHCCSSGRGFPILKVASDL
jgi:hypothetical protein